jgi:glycosyltransferase involved in cell wall biosynthesis
MSLHFNPDAGVDDRATRHIPSDREPELSPVRAALLDTAVASADRPVKLSILMPSYNEERTIFAVSHALLSGEYPCEIELIVVDDGSTDATLQLLAALDDPRVVVHSHPENRGKGAALITAAALASGTHILPFDADFEYSPADIPRLLDPVIQRRSEVVYGSRLFGLNTVYQSYWYAIGNKLTTLVANVLFDAYVSDLHTCLKLVPLELFHRLRLVEDGFGLDTEMTAGLLRLGLRPFEVPVSYHSRSHAEGKKITWHDGIKCLLILIRVRFSPKYRKPVPVWDKPELSLPEDNRGPSRELSAFAVLDDHAAVVSQARRMA